jgi:hypothetical protein
MELNRSTLNPFIDHCIKHEQYLGLGNPNANILFVGKEAGAPVGTQMWHGSAEAWKTTDYSKRFVPEDKVRDKRHTWQKYQRLYESITEQPESVSEITFVENVFTSELSNLPAKTTAEAKDNPEFKENLKKRKDAFWRHDFVQRFPIVVIAALDNQYIETYPGEVQKLFDVDYIECIKVGKTEKMWIHHANKNSKVFPKLVIHTRQLTNGASKELLESIAELVKAFAEAHAIKL